MNAKRLTVAVCFAIFSALTLSLLFENAPDVQVLAPAAPRMVAQADSAVLEEQTAAQYEPTGMNAVYLPAILNPVPGLHVNVNNKANVVNFYEQHYVGSGTPDSGWNGNVGACDAGSTSAEFKAAVAERINYYRAMAGLPADIKLMNAEFNAKAQQAALMMSAERDLEHFPGTGWKCYSRDGAEAAGLSNLSLGDYGPAAVTSQFEDAGRSNGPVGHRRWILFPWFEDMGTGDVPGRNGNPAANALWVVGAQYVAERPTPRDTFVAWPPPGYVPYQVVYARWSFSLDTDAFGSLVAFDQASVKMTIDGQVVPVTIEAADAANALSFGDKAIVWRPQSMSDGANWPRPNPESVIQIELSNVIDVDGMPRTFRYTVRVIDP